MSLKANRSYLIDEQSRLSNRIQQIESYLIDHPPKYLAIRKIKGKEYLYVKYRLNGKYTSEYISNDLTMKEEICISINELKDQRARAKEQLKKTKTNLKVVKKQINIINKTIDHG
jgi:hypothetical protein